jgi:3-deoxy-7-phosphoheptulonate synthase
MTIRDNLHISKAEPLGSPKELKALLPLSENGSRRVMESRENIQKILEHKSDKLIVIVGPCSIHSPEEAIEYAKLLKKLSFSVSDKLMLIMRVYFEKPRTTIGWKGLIYDPDLDGSCHMSKGLKIARKLLLEIDELGLPTATEILGPVTAQYIADLVSWAAIGARTTESQTHRQLASGLSMPVGFKNTTNGNISTAVEAIKAAMHKHVFLGVLEDGRSGIFHTTGNKYSHIILRGGINEPNYVSEYIAYTRELMKKNTMTPNIIIDCSHANSQKNASKQYSVVENVIKQKKNIEKSIVGIMIESNIMHGKQKMNNLSSLKHGVSITDECIGWQETEEIIMKLYNSI